jgi:alpha-amylase/alpha-mannosidase (GH57 family)
MIYWAPLLHFYQPPTQYHNVLARIGKESYRPLLKVFKDHPHAKVTVNMCGVLTEMLSYHGYSDILSDLRQLGEKGQVEFVGSAKYHPILPLIPEEETKRQIELNRDTNLSYFKDAYRPLGFFLPEMCYSDEVTSIVRGMGYEWLIVSGIACQGKWPLDFITALKPSSGVIRIFYRDDILSNRISFRNIDPKGFISSLKDLARDRDDIYVITAMDGETFGHHIKNWERLFLAATYEMIEDSDEIKVVNISELLKKFPTVRTKPPRPSSWSTTKEEIMAGNFYALWNTPHNKIHRLQWEHVNLGLEILQLAQERKDNEKSQVFFNMARETMDAALHSCQFWWANKETRWSENIINRGLMLQEEAILNAYLAVAKSSSKDSDKKRCCRKLIVARDIAGKIRDEILS